MGDLVKSRSREDVKTLSRNLSQNDKSEEASQDRKVRRKKRFNADAKREEAIFGHPNTSLTWCIS